jgi:hypothetical protein
MDTKNGTKVPTLKLSKDKNYYSTILEGTLQRKSGTLKKTLKDCYARLFREKLVLYEDEEHFKKHGEPYATFE